MHDLVAWQQRWQGNTVAEQLPCVWRVVSVDGHLACQMLHMLATAGQYVMIIGLLLGQYDGYVHWW